MLRGGNNEGVAMEGMTMRGVRNEGIVIEGTRA
jgi:hypothetical protein